MKLTGQAKKDFDKWWNVKNVVNVTTILGEYAYVTPNIKEFVDFPQSMQYGVYVDWFDSVRIYIDIVYNGINWGFAPDIDAFGENVILPHRNTRQEARIKAIEKANEIYNSK